MGNTPVKIGIRLDRGVVEAGNVLKGRVYLSVRGRNQRAQAVHLVLKGVEKSVVVKNESDGNRNHEMRRRQYTVSNLILNMDFPLKSFSNGIVPPGQYEYPFEWPLPQDIPSSMRMNSGDSSCAIEYSLTVDLRNSTSAKGHEDCSSTVPLTVLGFSKPNAKSVQMDVEAYNIKACCSNKGTMLMGWDADTSVAAPEGVINVGIIGRNDSLIETQYLQVTLRETVTWSANGHTETRVQNIGCAKICVNESTLWKPLPYLSSKAHWRGQVNETMLGQDVIENRTVAQLHVSKDVRDSYRGSLINVRHALTVTVVTPGACCVTSPESSVIMTVQRRMPNQAGPLPVSTPTHTAPEGQLISPLAEMEFFLNGQDPPLAVAELLPADWMPEEAAVVVIPASAVHVPASASENASQVSENVVPSAPPDSLLREARQPSMKLGEIQATLAASKTPAVKLQEFLQNPANTSTIQNLSPHEFVEILRVSSRQDVDFAQNSRMLALTMAPKFYCRHMLACLWSLPTSVRFDVLRELVPLTSDIDLHRNSLEGQLDPSELSVLRTALA